MPAAVLLTAMLSMMPAQAVGLGELRLQSALGQPLRGSLPLLGEGAAAKASGCFSASLSNVDGGFVAKPRIAVIPDAGGASLALSTAIAVVEPAVVLTIEMGCGDALRKEFSLLLDPPTTLAGTTASNGQQSGARAVAQAEPLLPSSRRDDTPGASPADAPGLAPFPARRPAAAPKRSRSADQVAPPVAGTIIPKTRAAVRDRIAPSKNVLRLTSRDGNDADLVNAIGLRLAGADRLGAASGSAAGGGKAEGAMPDIAKTAADRAAQARFAAVLRDDPNGEKTLRETTRTLQELQNQMQALEADTTRLKQEGRRPAPEGFGWLPVLAALLLLSAGAIVWLLIRMKHLKQRNTAWDWDKNVSAADARNTDMDAASAAHAVATPGVATPRNASASGANVVPADLPAQVIAAAATVPAPAADTGAPVPRPTPAPAAAPLEFYLEDIDRLRTAQAAAATVAASEPDDLHAAEFRLQQLAVEEISDVMQEAEFWISLHDAQRAVEVLEPYATGDQPGSPLPWLYLFDLYRDLARQDRYDSLHERFQRIYNAKMPTWHEGRPAVGGGVQRSLEDLPHVALKIVALWDTGGILPYLESLLIDDRDGSRIGFDLPVYREIMFLIMLAYALESDRAMLSHPATGGSGLTRAA